MNIKNNKRRQETVHRIESAFLEFLKNQDISKIKVTAICDRAGINRGTFYANFLDVYDLADKLHTRLIQEVNDLFESDIQLQNTNADFIKLFEHMFEHIRKNQELYHLYFKLGYDDIDNLKMYAFYQFAHNFKEQNLHYHVTFFKSGFNAIIKTWLNNGCKETPQEMRDILLLEYQGRICEKVR